MCGSFSGHLNGNADAPSVCTNVSSDANIFNSQSINPVECQAGGKKGEIMSSVWVSGNYGTTESIQGKLTSDMCGFLLNNCPNGLRDQAVIYMMGQLAQKPRLIDGRNITDNNFSSIAPEAIKLQKWNPC